ncbi:hypothetical protein IJJ49_01840 [Candidatus Saccharibacteria bacterium]|nr:hypothetical protein [Candidatus Saccharibacteria bacterium]
MARRRRRNRKWISWVALILLAAMAGVVCWFVYDSYFREEERSGEETTVVQPGEEQKNEPEKEPEAEKTSAGTEKKKIEQYEGEDPNVAEGLTGVITYAGVTSGVLRIRVNIDQYLSSGNCTLTLSRDGATVYSETVSVVDSAATATCQGFDINTAEISGAGKVNISVLVSAGEKTGTIKGEAQL